ESLAIPFSQMPSDRPGGILKNKLPRHPLSEEEHKSAAIALFAKEWTLTRSDAETRWPTLHPDVQTRFLDSKFSRLDTTRSSHSIISIALFASSTRPSSSTAQARGRADAKRRASRSD